MAKDPAIKATKHLAQATRVGQNKANEAKAIFSGTVLRLKEANEELYGVKNDIKAQRDRLDEIDAESSVTIAENVKAIQHLSKFVGASA